MERYDIHYTKQAENDLDELAQYIGFGCFAPLTAKRYIDGLYARIQWLETSAEIFPVVPELSYSMGFSVRQVNYNKMAILYSVEDHDVFIHRIIAQSLIVY